MTAHVYGTDDIDGGVSGSDRIVRDVIEHSDVRPNDFPSPRSHNDHNNRNATS